MEILSSKPKLSEAQTDAAQLAIMQLRSAEFQSRTWNVLNAAVLMFLFGAFCAIWAQNTDRNAWLWFGAGFLLTFVTVLYILWLNPKPKKRGRRMFIYGNVSR